MLFVLYIQSGCESKTSGNIVYLFIYLSDTDRWEIT